ncbi:MAG: MFS transporter [Candidatus Hydrogenedentes bacterium]|nr:MFS transporter [Candidatus Hydrogenedentota bacterium]MBI3119261.1 MFS transporter [Candidatus Hydrogenedentota bacterium]
MSEAHARNGSPIQHDKILFWGCFMSLVATAFTFVVRGMVIKDWAVEFGLTNTQQGEILGVGLWPFALSIVLFSLVIDKIGYGRAMVFAFVCHVSSTILIIFANGYWMLYIATFIVALGNGTVEAVINPVVATMFSREKTKWLNILHAGWPGGLVLGGILAISLGAESSWKLKVALLLLPAIIYGIMLVGRKFPVHERVAAGISYKDMLKEAGALGALIIIFLMTWEVGRVFEFPLALKIGIVAVLTIAYGLYVQSLGRPLFIFLLLIMIPLATTELGTDSWITPLMESEMTAMGLQAAWVLVYTSFIMMLLRFSAGPIVHKLSPLGLLATCSVIAAIGLVSLSMATGVTILLAATIYGVGKTFFWPTMLGVVAERFPKGGALTINIIAGVGTLSVGIVGTVFLGSIQDQYINRHLTTHDAAQGTQLASTYVTQEKVGIFGKYTAVDPQKVAAAPAEEQTVLNQIISSASKNALQVVAIFPVIMFVCYLILIVYFKSRGGYTAVHLEQESTSG